MAFIKHVKQRMKRNGKIEKIEEEKQRKKKARKR